jgi:tagatose-6-phosphate ketose/aldose isomerase
MQHLGLEESLLVAKRAIWTAREIEQQPGAWLRTAADIEARKGATVRFLAPLLADDKLRIILTGAGSSAYIGTTDLVSSPRNHFQRQVPTLLVSFGRSGNSPESSAAIDIAEQLVDTCHQLVITCNGEGALFRRCQAKASSLAILLPEETHDRSFAMTSSFSSMLYAGLLSLGGTAPHVAPAKIAAAGRQVIADCNLALQTLAAQDYQRVVYLGSNALSGVAHEASLKLLELTDGEIVSMAQSSLGFRHGPKAIVNRKTLIIMFISNDYLTRRYDLDLLRELRMDGIAAKVLALTAQADAAKEDLDFVSLPDLDTADDAELMFPYVTYAQLYAFHRALRLDKAPDSPSASGTVSRVVQGVTIHPL